MSYNLPPGVTDADIDREMGGDTTSEQDGHIEVIERSKEACEMLVKATVDILIKKRFMASKDALEAILQGLAEELDHETDEAQRALNADDVTLLGYDDFTPYPQDYKGLIDREFERLMDAFRPKAVNSVAVLKEILRPAVTNPATPGFGGELEPLAKAKE